MVICYLFVYKPPFILSCQKGEIRCGCSRNGQLSMRERRKEGGNGYCVSGQRSGNTQWWWWCAPSGSAFSGSLATQTGAQLSAVSAGGNKLHTHTTITDPSLSLVYIFLSDVRIYERKGRILIRRFVLFSSSSSCSPFLFIHSLSLVSLTVCVVHTKRNVRL